MGRPAGDDCISAEMTGLGRVLGGQQAGKMVRSEQFKIYFEGLTDGWNKRKVGSSRGYI